MEKRKPYLSSLRLFATACTVMLCCLLPSSNNTAAAQDTIHTTQPLSNYLYNCWHDYKPGDTMYFRGYPYSYYKFIGLVLENEDSLPIYGVAMGVKVDTLYPQHLAWDPDSGYYYADNDTTWDSVYFDIMAYNVCPDSIYRVGEKLRLHVKHTPVSYYLHTGMVEPYYNPLSHYLMCDTVPVYELYYDSPITVTDTFYLGGINRTDEEDPESGFNRYHLIFVPTWERDNSNTCSKVMHWTPNPNLPEEYIGNEDCWLIFQARYYEWFFPILTPNPDSTYIPDDSTQAAVRQAAWERYVAVSPNPAAGTAKVVSSFGLTRVEAIDRTGVKILDTPAGGLSHSIDVGNWPSGTYLLRIHTPMGVTVKKLLVSGR